MQLTPDPKVVEKTVAVLRQRIRDDREYLARYETRTRVVIIDPLLRVLGWDPENSDDVQLEFIAADGRPDYALMQDGVPLAVIEAKKLGADLGTDVQLQVIKYIQDPECSGIGLVAVTDGDEWIFCRKSGGWKDERVKISSGQPFKTAYEIAECLAPSKLGVAVAQRTGREKGRPSAPRRGKWYPLVGELPNQLPAAVRFGDDPPSEWVSWRELYAGLAEQLVSSGYIRKSDLPVWVAKGKYCAINDEPIHPGPDRKPFGNPMQIGEGMWLEAYGNRNTLRDYSGRLLREFHSDPESVQVWFD